MIRPTFFAPEKTPICERKDLLTLQKLHHPRSLTNGQYSTDAALSFHQSQESSNWAVEH